MDVNIQCSWYVTRRVVDCGVSKLLQKIDVFSDGGAEKNNLSFQVC